MEGTAADRGARRVDTGHTRTVCSGTIADPFFHVGPDSSHNTSKVTKAEGKQIRGRGLNRFIKHSCAPEVVPIVAESGDDADEDDGDVDVAWPSSRAQVCITLCVFTSVPPCREGQERSSLLLYVREMKAISHGGGKERTGRRSQTTFRQTFFSFVRLSQADGKRL